MKKFLSICLCAALTFILCGCDIYVYNVGDNEKKTEENTSTNLTTGGSGSTIIDLTVDYKGTINYTEEIPDSNLSWKTIYNNVITSVVTIRNIQLGKIKSTGSGVFFAQDSTVDGYAYIYTNAHVVEGANSVEILLSNNKLVAGTIIGYDKVEDVAVVKTPKRNDYTLATLRKSETLKIGEEVLAIGSPLGEKYDGTATSGIISNLNISQTPDESTISLYLIQVDAALNPGNSGGPLFDKGGNLIGINSMKLLTSGSSIDLEAFNYSIPISHFSLVASYLLQGSLYYRPFLNISVLDIRYLTIAERERENITINYGLLIDDVDDKSPAKGKIFKGQIITQIEDVLVLKDSDFSIELLKHAPNEEINITVCNSDGSNSQVKSIVLTKR